MNSGVFRIIGFDEGEEKIGPKGAHRLVCNVEGGGKIAIWGSEHSRSNIDAVLKAGLPCNIECEYRPPGPDHTHKYGHTHWVPQTYLLRNRSRGRGVGFFEAGNFHPDFILWLLAGDRQHVTFVDPKGIRNIGVDDPKIRFFETIKEIERRLGDPKVALDSFIVSRTPSHVMQKL